MTYPKATSQSGFTLIEMVSVMVLLGILAVTAIPSFTGSDDFSAYSAQDQIIAGARMAQQRAMYDRASPDCYYLNIASNVITVQRVSSGLAIGPTQDWLDGITIDSDVPIKLSPGGATLINVYFDGLGNAVGDSDGLLCDGAQNAGVTTIAINNPATLNVCINPVGYIYAC